MTKPSIALTLACLLVWPASASERINTNYRGPDAGTLIFSTSTLRISMNFSFFYKKKGDARDADSLDGAGDIVCRCVGLWHPIMSDPDYNTGYESGKVQIQHLPPGDYEIYTLNFGGSLPGLATVEWFPKKGFSIPFTIKAGEATYIGNFARHPSLGTPLASQLGATGYFIVSDKSTRDIGIAKTRDPNLPPVTMSVTDVAPLRLPFLLPNDDYGPTITEQALKPSPVPSPR